MLNQIRKQNKVATFFRKSYFKNDSVCAPHFISHFFALLDYLRKKTNHQTETKKAKTSHLRFSNNRNKNWIESKKANSVFVVKLQTSSEG